jgi:hypothetical protein
MLENAIADERTALASFFELRVLRVVVGISPVLIREATGR